MTADDRPAVAQATLRPKRRVSAAWVLTGLALVMSIWLGFQAWSLKGVAVTILLERGHGLEPGDAVRFRGIAVGEVRSVKLAADQRGVIVRARLYAQADELARAGSRFWVVRPQLGLGGVAGLETLIGPRYLAVLPGKGRPQRSFLGQDDPPVISVNEPGDLEIIVAAEVQGALKRGSPVTYRQVRVGTILSVGLTSDGGAVEARVHIEKPFVQLIRPETRFWSTGGLDAKLGLAGASFHLESLEDLIAGGVALATPANAGEVVRTGHRFRLEADPPDGWLDWQPLVVIGSEMLPAGAPLPTPLRAQLDVKRTGWIGRDLQRAGWVLQTAEGLLGPSDLLRVSDSTETTPALEVAGTAVTLDTEPRWSDGGLAVIDVHVTGAIWPPSRMRAAREPEDCVAVADPTAPPLPLAASRLTTGDVGWLVDPAVSLDETWHGACVVARADGHLVGLLLLSDGMATVALLPRRGGDAEH